LLVGAEVIELFSGHIDLSVMRVGCAKTAEWIDLLLVVETLVNPKKTIRQGFPFPLSNGEEVGCGLRQTTRSGSANEDQLRLGRQRQVWFIPFVDKRVDVQVQL